MTVAPRPRLPAPQVPERTVPTVVSSPAATLGIVPAATSSSMAASCTVEVTHFDDDATPIILGSGAYDTHTKTSDGNPYADTIAGLIKSGVVIAVCGNDLASKSLTAENLLPGVKSTPRGILLVAQLARDGTFCLPTPLPGAQPKD